MSRPAAPEAEVELQVAGVLEGPQAGDAVLWDLWSVTRSTVVSSGTLSDGNPQITLSPEDWNVANDFTVNAGFDDNGDGVLSTAEIQRNVKVIVRADDFIALTDRSVTDFLNAADHYSIEYTSSTRGR